MKALPENVHDLAYWLCVNLENADQVDGGAMWEGKVPDDIDFSGLVAHIDSVPDGCRLAGESYDHNRTIEFYPSKVSVYKDISDFLRVEINRKKAPEYFVIISPLYSHNKDFHDCDPSHPIAKYFDLIELWNGLKSLTDIPGDREIFIVSSEGVQLSINCEYGRKDLEFVSNIKEFTDNFLEETIHVSQKKAIIKNVLTKHFSKQKNVSVSQIIEDFEGISQEVVRSYEMYVQEFSYQKTYDEIERRNLEDNLRLNKTLSDIQSQLLALPASIILAGTTIRSGEDIRNYSILLGVLVFLTFMLFLVSNQFNSVKAISNEIAFRKKTLKKLPCDIKEDLTALFTGLEERVVKQKFVLKLIASVTVAIAIISTAAVIIA